MIIFLYRHWVYNVLTDKSNESFLHDLFSFHDLIMTDPIYLWCCSFLFQKDFHIYCQRDVTLPDPNKQTTVAVSYLLHEYVITRLALGLNSLPISCEIMQIFFRIFHFSFVNFDIVAHTFYQICFANVGKDFKFVFAFSEIN